jgi:hypothetical protein
MKKNTFFTITFLSSIYIYYSKKKHQSNFLSLIQLEALLFYFSPDLGPLGEENSQWNKTHTHNSHLYSFHGS